jgi:hypothetical protein
MNTMNSVNRGEGRGKAGKSAKMYSIDKKFAKYYTTYGDYYMC